MSASKPARKGFSLFSGAGIGAAFLMANSSIGPGFLTQTTVFTQDLLAAFGFVILVSVLLDLGAQLNTWRVLTVSGLRAQDLANKLRPGLGYVLAALVVAGGFAFNIGNIAGCGLALNTLFGLGFREGAAISCLAALALFWIKETGPMLDGFTRIVGVIKILLTCFIAFSAHPPLLQAARETILPHRFSAAAIVTIVGGTVGGYITFSGAHRLLDAGIKGREALKKVDRSALSGILISALMRSILFLAVLGVVSKGFALDKDNPAASVFGAAAGTAGLCIFGIVFWSAAISSVMGAAYTSVSFVKTFHPAIERNEKWAITAFLLLTTFVFLVAGRPRELLLAAGAVNGMILPIALGVILVAASRPRLMGGYRHPLWMQAAGWVVVAAMGSMAVWAIVQFVR